MERKCLQPFPQNAEVRENPQNFFVNFLSVRRGLDRVQRGLDRVQRGLIRVQRGVIRVQRG